MDWKQSLDRYLTNPPDDGFDGFAENVINQLPDDFFNEYESWLFSEKCDFLLYSYFRDGYTVEQAVGQLQVYAKISEQ